MRKFFVFMVVCILTGLLPPTLTAQSVRAWSSDSNVNRLVCKENYWGMAMASDGSGGAIVAWGESERSGEPRLHAQRLDATGSSLWTQQGICTAKGRQYAPIIADDGLGGAIVAWWNVGDGGGGIRAQKLNNSGKRQWTAGGVAVAQAYNVVMISDGYGGAIVVWQDSGLYAQRLDSSGTPQWGAERVPLCIGAGNWLYPMIASDGYGGAIIAWYDGPMGGGGIDSAYAQRVDSEGIPQWTTNGNAVCLVPSDQRTLAIASDGSGGAIIAWDDGRSPNGGVYAQRLNSAGELQWAAEGVFVCPATHKGTHPVMVSDGSGGAIIALDSGNNTSDGENSDIYTQRLDSAGRPQWTPGGLAICSAQNNQVEPVMVSDGSGGAVIAWQDGRSSEATDRQDQLWSDEANVSHNDDIYAQRVDSSGTLEWTPDGVPICTAPNLQRRLQVVGDGSGGAIIGWADYRDYPLEGMRADVALVYDTYVQRVDGAGVLGPASSDGGFPSWIWIVVALGAVLVVGASIVIWRSRRTPSRAVQMPS